jgi:stearoyl-CoA desaturase (delta-9 desaturase)
VCSSDLPVLFWSAVHQQHHRASDEEIDPSSPKHYGFFESFLIYRFRESVLKKTHIRNYCVKQILKDPVLMFLSKHFTKIIWSVIIVLASIDLNLLLNLFLIPVALEHVRTNLVSSLSHMKIPFSYRNYETNDNSQNNFILGYLTFGFSWHNNHHAHPRNSSCHEKWWEVDVEGIICRLLNKK